MENRHFQNEFRDEHQEKTFYKINDELCRENLLFDLLFDLTIPLFSLKWVADIKSS